MIITKILLIGGAIYLSTKTHLFHKKNNLATVLTSPDKPQTPVKHTDTLTTLLPSRFRALLESDEQTEEEQIVNHYLVVSVAATGLAALGGLFYAPLSVASLPLSIYTCVPIYQIAYQALVKEGRLRAEFVDAIALTGIFFTRYYFALALGSVLYFTGSKFMLRTEDNSRKNLTNLFGEQPRMVWRVVDGVEVETPFEALRPGDVIVVNAGEMVPVDGRIVEGHGSLDQHKLTGESQPAEKGPADPVFAATVLLAGRLYIQIEKAGSETVAAQIGEILNRTTDFKSLIEARSQKLADQLVLPTLGVGTLALLSRGLVGGVAAISANFSDVFRVVGPLGMLNFLQLATKEGILIKDGRSLELLNQVDTVVFDKTGTLTLEQLQVSQIHACGTFSEDELLTYAATAEHRQSHPIAKAIQQAAIERNLTLPPLDEASYEVGYGLRVRIGAHQVRVGSARFMNLEQITLPESIHLAQTEAAENGHSLVYLAVDDDLAGAIELQPTIRPEAKQVIADLKKRGLSLYIISGDHEQPTRTLAAALSIDHYFAEVLPEDKANLVAQLQQAGRCVCFVGDGINDSIALKKANVSISIRGASTIATDTAQIVLMNQSLSQLDTLFQIAHDLDTNMRSNLVITFGPGLFCVGGVFFLHFGILSAVALYNVSLVAGVTNAMLPWLQRHRLLAAPDNSQQVSLVPNNAEKIKI